jgi:hypothetical protein
MPDTELVSQYVDRTGVESDTEFILGKLRAVQDALNKVSQIKVTLDEAKTFRTAAEATGQLKTATTGLVDAQGKLLSTNTAITTGTTKQKDALSQLNSEYKEAQRNAANMAIQFGVQSDEALKAADAAAKLKEKLDAATNFAKGKTIQTTNSTSNTETTDVKLSTNLGEIEAEQKRVAEATGTVVDELQQQETASILTAQEWADAQLKAGGAAADASEEVNTLAGAFDNVQTPLQQYTGSLSDNIRQSQQYKDRLKEINAEIKNLDTSNPIGQQDLAALTQEQAKIKIAAADVNQTINAQIKYFNAAEGSTDQLSQKLGIMRNVFRSLSDTEKAGTFGQTLLKDIQNLDAVVKQSDASIGNFQRNVGNYAGSLSPLFDKLTAEIERLKTEQKGLQDFSQRNPVGFQIGGADQLNQVTASLEKLQQVQQVGFKTTGSYTAQVENLDKAFTDLAQSGTQSEAFLKDIQQALERIKPVNTSSFSGAFKVLENELGTVRQKLNDPALSGKQLESLQNEERLLTQLTENLSRTFTTSRQELFAFTDASVKLGAVLGTADETVVAFQQAVGEAANEVQDLKKTIQFQASDTKFLTGAVTAVTGLTGAYSAAQGAAQLFGSDNEELQKKMVKLQALLTITTGLQQFANALQEENGVIQLALAAKIGLVNAAKSVEAKLFGATAASMEAEVIATEQEVAAQAQLAATAGVAAEGQTVLAVGAGEAAVAMEGEAVAAGTATVATKTFATSLIATGIGAIVVAIGVAVAYLVSKVNDWAGANGIALDKLNKLNDAIKDENALLVEQADLFVNSQSGFKTNLEAQLTAAEKAGKSQVQLFAIRKQIANEEKALAQAGLDALGVSGKQETTMLNSIQKLQTTKQGFIEDLQKAQAAGDDNAATAAQKNIEGTEKSIQKIKPLYDAVIGARTRLTQANQAQGQLEIEQQKFNDDEQRKLILQSTSIEVDLTKDKNSRILSSDRSNLSERLAALRSNAEAEKKLIAAQKNDVLSDPSISAVDRTLAIKKAGAEIKKVNDQLNKESFDAVFSERVREVTAIQDAAHKEIEIEATANKEIASNQVFSLEQRLQAQQKYAQDQKKLIDDTLALQLTNAGFSDKEIEEFKKTGKANLEHKKINAQELLDVQTQYETSLLKLNIDTGNSINEIIKSDLLKQKALFDQNLTDIERAYSTVDLSIHVDYSKEIIALNNSLKTRQISEEKYARKREEIEFQSQQKLTANAIESVQTRLKTFTDTAGAEMKARADLELSKQLLAQATTDVLRAELKKQVDIAQAELDIATSNNEEYKKLVAQANALATQSSDNSASNTKRTNAEKVADSDKVFDHLLQINQQITSLGDAIADRTIDNLKKQEDALESRYGREVDLINQTMVNGVAKEKALAEAEARHAATRNQLDARERDAARKKAIFDKASAITSIILSTAKAVAADLVKPAQIPFDLAIGAIELATAIAAPLPQYYMGKNVSEFEQRNTTKTTHDRYEGPAIVGDGGRSELIVREDGRMEVTPAQSTITYLKSKDIVLPDAKKALAQMEVVTNNMDNRVSSISSPTTIQTYNMARHYETTKSDDVHFKKFNDTMSKGFQSLEDVIKNKQENHFHFSDRGKLRVHNGKGSTGSV